MHLVNKRNLAIIIIFQQSPTLNHNVNPYLNKKVTPKQVLYTSLIAKQLTQLRLPTWVDDVKFESGFTNSLFNLEIEFKDKK